MPPARADAARRASAFSASADRPWNGPPGSRSDGFWRSPSSPPVQQTSTVWTCSAWYLATVAAPLEASSSGWAWTLSSASRSCTPVRLATRLPVGWVTSAPTLWRHATTSTRELGARRDRHACVTACDTDDGREMQTPDSYARFQLREHDDVDVDDRGTGPDRVHPVTTSTTPRRPRRAPARRRPRPRRRLAPGRPRNLPRRRARPSPRRRRQPAAVRRARGPTGRRSPSSSRATAPTRSPLITWTAPPDGTAELAVSVIDPDANGFVHWLVIGLPAEAGSVGGGEPVVDRRLRGGQLVREPGLGRSLPAPG